MLEEGGIEEKLRVERGVGVLGVVELKTADPDLKCGRMDGLEARSNVV